jgi:hypothetical protein
MTTTYKPKGTKSSKDPRCAMRSFMDIAPPIAGMFLIPAVALAARLLWEALS